MGRRFAEPVARANVRERGTGIGVAGVVLEVEDVAAAFAGSRQCRHAQGIYRVGSVALD